MKKEHYVDIHSHILPGIDDGSHDIDESVAMLELAYNEGIGTVIATPHYGRCNPNFDVAKCDELIDELNKLVANSGDKYEEMRILPGNELLYHTDISQEVMSGKAHSIADGDRVLVEFYNRVDYPMIVACVHEFKDAGYRTIIAHAERYECLRNDLEKVRALRNEGALIQVNADNFTDVPAAVAAKMQNSSDEKGIRGAVRMMRDTIVGGAMLIRDEMNTCKEAAWEFLLNGLVDYIASDSHGDIFRRPIMNTAIDTIRTTLGEEVAAQIIKNSRNLIGE